MLPKRHVFSIRTAVDELQPPRVQVLEIGFPCEVIEWLSFSNSQPHIPTVAGENGAHTWPVGDIICAGTKVRKLAAEYIQQALRGVVVEAFYFIVSKIEDLLDARVVIVSDYRIRRTYIEQASTGAHHEPSLVEACDTGGIVVWLSVVQMRARIRHVHHGGKIRVP